MKNNGLAQVFVKDSVAMQWFLFIGWIAPVLLMITYGIVREYYTEDAKQ